MQMRVKVRDVAAGKWPGILAGFGLTERQLSGKHCPCPACGGADRFRFDDQEGRGTWFCSHCGAGDGIKLVMALRGCDFRTAACAVEQAAGVVQARSPTKGIDESDKAKSLRRVWSESLRLVAGDEAARYFDMRGLPLISSDALRLHPALTYHDTDRIVGRYPALIARVVAADGSGVTLHRTYLLDGRKAPLDSPRKLMSAMPGKAVSGAAVRLYPVAAHIGIAEGIETAIAAATLFGLPVWSCINAHGVELFDPPAGIERVIVFGDNDENYTGQAAAYACAKRLALRGIAAEVSIPPKVGDWLDVLNERNRQR